MFILGGSCEPDEPVCGTSPIVCGYSRRNPANLHSRDYEEVPRVTPRRAEKDDCATRANQFGPSEFKRENSVPMRILRLVQNWFRKPAVSQEVALPRVNGFQIPGTVR